MAVTIINENTLTKLNYLRIDKLKIEQEYIYLNQSNITTPLHTIQVNNHEYNMPFHITMHSIHGSLQILLISSIIILTILYCKLRNTNRAL